MVVDTPLFLGRSDYTARTLKSPDPLSPNSVCSQTTARYPLGRRSYTLGIHYILALAPPLLPSFSMVMTRLSSSASRRRNLATIFDDASQRHVVTPPTPLTTTAPAAQSAGAAFLATIRTLTRERFDEAVAKHVVNKCFLDKYDPFTGLETRASVLVTKLVPAINKGDFYRRRTVVRNAF